jgi:integrase
MITRSRYQHGSIKREKCKRGPAVWTLRWRETKPDGSTTRRKEIIGTVEQFKTKADACKACEHLRSTINPNAGTPRTIGELVKHYQQKEMSEDGSKSFSTRTAYEVYLRNWIVPVWANTGSETCGPWQ